MNEVLTQKRIEKIFPDYFVEICNYPQVLKKKVFRCIGPCRSGKCDKASFIEFL